jgi:Uncharacterized protein conserved in bacteria
MAQPNAFLELLMRLKILRVDDAPPDAPRRTGGQPLDESPSIYENRYSHSRGQDSAPRYGSEKRTRTGGSNVPANKLRQDQPVPRPDTMVYYLSSLSECATVIRDIIAGTSALVNFDDTDDRLSQRILDTLAGAAFALNAKVRKITDNTYLIAPENVKVNMSRHVERRY